MKPSSIGDVDPYGVLPADGQIVTLQSPAQPAALNPHDGIFTRIKVGFPPKNFGSHGVALNFLGAGRTRFFPPQNEESRTTSASSETLDSPVFSPVAA